MKILTGIVVSAKTPKTVTVEVSREAKHPLYGKSVKRTKKYLCHCEVEVKLGDTVKIQETRPMSRHKRFKVAEKVQG